MHNGLLLLDKPKGITSHDAVLALRRELPKGTKVGHSGTLDPMASGLLILLVGPATKKAVHYQNLPKIYSGTIRLGQETETGDLDGKILKESPIPDVTAEQIQAVMRSFQGTLEMPPPIYSAVKYKGKPLYSYARKGIDVPRKNRTCTIFDWELLDFTLPEVKFRLRCSSGTYARSLAVELGHKIGSVAVLSELRREKVGDFDVSAALKVATMQQLSPEKLSGALQPANPPLQPAAA